MFIIVEIIGGLLTNFRFRWAPCQLEALAAFQMPNDLLDALCLLPKSLSETYRRILDNIPESDLSHSRRILTFLTYAERPLYINEAVDVLATTFKKTPSFHPDYRMPVPKRVVNFCSSLVTLTNGGQLVLAHSSVHEYLTSNEDKGHFSRISSQRWHRPLSLRFSRLIYPVLTMTEL